MTKTKTVKPKTKKFEGYVALTLDDIMSLGSTEKTIGDLFLDRVKNPKLSADLKQVWHENQFDYAVVGSTPNQEVLIYVSGVLAEVPVKKTKGRPAAKKAEPVKAVPAKPAKPAKSADKPVKPSKTVAPKSEPEKSKKAPKTSPKRSK